MMENDVLTMRICKDIIGSNWFLRIGAVRAVACSASRRHGTGAEGAATAAPPIYGPLYLTGGTNPE